MGEMSKLSDEQMQALKQMNRFELDYEDAQARINQLLAHIGEMERELEQVRAIACQMELAEMNDANKIEALEQDRSAAFGHLAELVRIHDCEPHAVIGILDYIRDRVRPALATPPREQGDGK